MVLSKKTDPAAYSCKGASSSPYDNIGCPQAIEKAESYSHSTNLGFVDMHRLAALFKNAQFSTNVVVSSK